MLIYYDTQINPDTKPWLESELVIVVPIKLTLLSVEGGWGWGRWDGVNLELVTLLNVHVYL